MPDETLIRPRSPDSDVSIENRLQPVFDRRIFSFAGNKQQGMTMIELLIAMMLGAFLLGGVIQIFINTKQTYRVQEALSRLQENGRFALEFIAKDVRMAGYFGCLSNNFSAANIENELNDTTNFAWNITDPVIGYDDVASTFALVSSVVTGTDVLATYRMSETPVPLVSPFNNGAQMFAHPDFNSDCPAAQATSCHEGEIFLVTDCRQGTIFQATNTTVVAGGSGVNVVHSANNTYVPGNDSPATFTRSYGAGSQIARLNTFVYYIRLNPAGEPALYRSRLSTTNYKTNALAAEELVEGIENMQITYGVDTDADDAANYFVSAANVTAANWANVVAVRISLLARTPANNVTSAAVSYTYNGATVTPTDLRLRRVFTSTIALRNRLN